MERNLHFLNIENAIKKIAVPTRGNEVDDHFGHCDTYSLYTIGENQQIVMKEIIPSPKGCGCKSDIAITLKEKEVQLMLIGNIGQGAINKLGQQGINVIRGCQGDADQVVKAWLKGEVKDSGSSCEHHHHHSSHSCSH